MYTAKTITAFTAFTASLGGAGPPQLPATRVIRTSIALYFQNFH